MSDVYQSLAHSKWDCKYHVVFVPKRRRKAIFGPIRSQLGAIFHALAKQKECQIVEGHLMPDHVHMCIEQTKMALLEFLIAAAEERKSVVHYCGIGKDLIEYTVDRSPYKQGRVLPGTHIPIHHPDRSRETKPDYVVILPWNLKDEIIEQLQFIREWGAGSLYRFQK
jgi:REP element-mobilizing transposase RayT